ncbi:MAG TPA: signal recognition particle protein [Candidatus Methylacidiphilales bacterium]|nr:signal recognition particle protein [Candidatus Methylacidiphilales bacterium]
MISQLSEKLQGVFKTLRGHGKLTESNVADAVKEVRTALLAADVNFQVVKEFTEEVKKRAMGTEVLTSIRPGEQFIKIVHDELIARFSNAEPGLSKDRPLRILMVGLNGAGKTTTAAKLALFYKKRKQQVVLVAGDLMRPAAIKQLQTLGRQIGISVLAYPDEKDVVKVARDARAEAERLRAEVIIFDAAGRLDVDQTLLDELEAVNKAWEPKETLLVADAATGQTAVKVAEAFTSKVNITGLVLSKFDADVRGGAALSFQYSTKVPIKFLGTGESPGEFEEFVPERLVGRMLGFGDIIGLVEKAQLEFDEKEAEKMQANLKKGKFDLQDFLDQMRMLKKMGPVQNLLAMIPGMSNVNISPNDLKSFGRVEAMIYSMTKEERKNPDILNARRRIRIANGSGTSVSELNDLLKRFAEMKKVMTKLLQGGNPEKMLAELTGGHKQQQHRPRRR